MREDAIEIAESLLEWYRRNARDLPWRRMQADPYAVWISEVMLQQTQVRTVIPYFLRWMARFPTIRSLAESPLEEVLSVWAGLGYYARARNLHRAAQEVASRFSGRIPADVTELSDLPGVGRYTAGAIASIAYNSRAPVVDANAARVLTRIYGIDGDPKSGVNQKRLWDLAAQLIPDGRASEFNQALMELGALVCVPSDPKCGRCPISNHCAAGISEDPTRWPQIPPGKRTIRVTHASAILQRDERILVVRRPPQGLWGGLWELPRRVCESGETPAACAVRAAQEVAGIEAESAESLGIVKHSVTHYAITLHGIRVVNSTGEPAPRDCDEVRWVSPADSVRLPLSSPQRILIQAVMGPGE